MNEDYLKMFNWALDRIADNPNIDKTFRKAVTPKATEEEQFARDREQHERNLTNTMAQEVADK